MKKIISFLLIMFFMIPLAGCVKTEKDIITISSYMIDNQDSDEMLNSDALFAYETSISENICLQIIYVWNNLLRRELRNDLLQIYEAIPKEDENIILNLDSKVTINSVDIGFKESSELSLAVLKSIFLTETKMNSKELQETLHFMIIRLETLEEFGNTEVIAIQTITKERTILKYQGNGKIIYINNLDEIN